MFNDIRLQREFFPEALAQIDQEYRGSGGGRAVPELRQPLHRSDFPRKPAGC
jgi:hypothetical protein